MHEIHVPDIRQKKINATQTLQKRKKKRNIYPFYSNILTRDTVTRMQTCGVLKKERNTNFEKSMNSSRMNGVMALYYLYEHEFWQV